jgi:RND family efflux transporter MFP subunit
MRLAVFITCAGLLAGCGRDDKPRMAHGDESWAVTAWGARYEIFAECAPLAVGRSVRSYTHVTALGDFSPLRVGVVSAVLSRNGEETSVFRQEGALRDGIFAIEIKPEEPGKYDLSFRIESPAGNEVVPAGRVRVGDAASPGGPVEPPMSGPYAPTGNASAGSVSFLKEQQWRTEFRTAWAEDGSVRASVRGPGTTGASAGAEVALSASLDGTVTGESRCYVGRAVERGETVMELAGRAASHRTLAELESEADLARARLARLEELLALEAVSVAEVEAARARATGLDAQLHATRGERGPKPVAVRAPFAGEIAEVNVVPGQAVSAGDPLARLVRRTPVWVKVALLPNAAAQVRSSPAGLVLRASGAAPVSVDSASVRLVSKSPEVDRTTGTVTTILEVKEALPFSLGTVLDAEILLHEELRGVVVPASAIVDDGGIPVVYVQIEGEDFVRQEVSIGTAEGDRVLVGGLHAGARVVVRGGGAIRRAALMSSGEVAGHVH